MILPYTFFLPPFPSLSFFALHIPTCYFTSGLENTYPHMSTTRTYTLFITTPTSCSRTWPQSRGSFACTYFYSMCSLHGPPSPFALYLYGIPASYPTMMIVSQRASPSLLVLSAASYPSIRPSLLLPPSCFISSLALPHHPIL